MGEMGKTKQNETWGKWTPKLQRAPGLLEEIGRATGKTEKPDSSALPTPSSQGAAEMNNLLEI